jgi:hypothetical protein
MHDGLSLPRARNSGDGDGAPPRLAVKGWRDRALWIRDATRPVGATCTGKEMG